MLLKYNIFELSNALKPFAAEELLKDPKIDSVIYFDCDLLIYSSFEAVEKVLQEHEIVITPHFLTPLPLDGLLLDEKAFLNTGVYNGGFFALKKGEETFKFLEWWRSRLQEYCFVDFSAGLFVDQIWLNFVPLYFKNVKVLQNLGYNVAYWNLHEREISSSNGEYFVNSSDKLVFFHFSGFDFSKPDTLSKYQSRYDFSSRPDVTKLFKDYNQKVLSNKFNFYRSLPCFYVLQKQRQTKSFGYIKNSFSTGKYYISLKKRLRRLLD
ncbi:glycosyl transferase [Pontibacter litorisediminis]|uniref:glycosyl transferase n=1 Tax=Pontibacter litorisediminis TaxID=1846260 RepID=UPI0023EBA39B|nr:glycosyl transferase [Pontibacter litorisediminis]